MLVKLEIPNHGAIPVRVWSSTLVGLLLGAWALGYWQANGLTTWNSIAHIADAQGRCAKTVTVLKTQQTDVDSLHRDLSEHPVSQSK